MSTIDQSPIVATHIEDEAPLPERRVDWLRIVRWATVAIWAVVVVWRTVTDGFAFNRELLLVYICTGLVAASIGQGRHVAGGPSGPGCMYKSARGVPDGGVLGAMQATQDGANDWIERIVGRGWGKLNLHSASALLDQGQASVNLVAAIPSLHAGMSAALAAFLWNRVHRAWRPVLVAYPLIMAFTLVYTAEHYVIDLLLGWALAAVVITMLARWERRRRRLRDTQVMEPVGAS